MLYQESCPTAASGVSRTAAQAMVSRQEGGPDFRQRGALESVEQTTVESGQASSRSRGTLMGMAAASIRKGLKKAVLPLPYSRSGRC
jgi:hypothetical protein